MAQKIAHIFLRSLIAVLFVGAVALIPLSRSSATSQKTIRVLVLKGAKNVSLSIQGSWMLLDEAKGEFIDEGERTIWTNVQAAGSGISVGGKLYPTKRIAIEPARDASITVNNRLFRGHVSFVANPEGTLNVINVVDLEKYIKGVLYHEISHKWPMEVIKAQAVAARSYAIYSMEQSKVRDFDVTNDIYSQVYGGKNSERYRTGLAVDETKGEVLIYNGKILPAFFHATCGGVTESVSEVWNMDLPPLRGGLCPYCKKSPHMKWKRNFRLKDIQSKLNLRGYKIGLIRSIEVAERNLSDRIKSLKITSRDGQVLRVSGKDFRDIVGPNDIRSNSYDVVMRGYYVDFYGRGWGHGVGLCQWGAYGMSQLQFDYKAILRHYYPGSRLADMDDLQSTR